MMLSELQYSGRYLKESITCFTNILLRFIYSEYEPDYHILLEGIHLIVLASDIGSTTTKAVVFDLSDGAFTAVGAVQEPTTVEPPFSDVMVGLFRAVRRLENETGLILIKGDSFTVPYYTTSSAGGGLQILVIGYTLADSCRIAESTAYGAGAVISGAFAMDSRGGRLNLIDKMSRLNPDLVLMAGGTDGGAVSGVVTMAYMLSLAKPEPKYGSGKLPVLFCGNVKAHEYVRQALGNSFDMQITENVVPGNHEINPRPAIMAVQSLFMEHVMKRAPGYPRLLDLVSAPVVPTPMGVSRILEVCSREMGKGALMVDMGGATTDIFTVADGKLQRTVAANIGMSFSMTNTLAEVGLPAVLRHIPGVDSETARSWIMGKTLFPTTLPRCETACVIEAAIAVEGLQTAWNHHLDVAYDAGRLSWREMIGISPPSAINPPLSTLSGNRFRLDGLDMLIGAGGIFSHSSPERAAWMLAEAFRPPGLTTLYVDSFFRSPHLGALLQSFPSSALKYYLNDCLKPVCRVLSPSCRISSKFVDITGPFRRKTVRAGGYLYLEDTTDITIQVFGPRIPGLENVSDGLPLLIDCRRKNDPLPMDFREGNTFGKETVQLSHREIDSPVEQKIRFGMSLPFSGMLNVQENDTVEPGQCLGQITEIPPRQFVLDVNTARSWPSGLSDEEIRRAVNVSPGDMVKTGDSIFKHSTRQYLAVYNSPMNGRITKILPPGVVIMEEDMEQDDLPHVVTVCRKMEIKPGQMSKFLRVSTGDFVYRGQLIANDPPVSMCTAPGPGFVTDIDHILGTVTIQYNMTPIVIESPLAGGITSTLLNRTVNMECTGLKLPGVLGFGRTVRGKLKPIGTSLQKGDIAFTSSPADLEIFEKAGEMELAGLVCPSISSNSLISWLGCEPGMFITGQEDLPFSLLILNGIGERNMTPGILESLKSSEGIHSALFPETKIRSGIYRPFMVISSDGTG